MGKILTFTGASGVGKTTLVEQLLQDSNQYKLVTSTSTRTPRSSDLPGEYEPLSKEEFVWLKSWNAFAWHQEFSGILYGTKHEYLEAAVQASHTSVMILIPERVQTLRELVNPELITSFYLRGPSEEELRSRMQKRNDTPATIERRLQECRAWDVEAQRSTIPYIFINTSGTEQETIEQVRSYLKQTL
jgi:guanylate kinase